MDYCFLQKMTTPQIEFLSKVESLIPKNSSLVNELIDILEISMDSAYRRMRGQTLLSIDEIIKLCQHFKISFDPFIQSETGHVGFTYTPLDGGKNDFEEYLKSLYKDLQIIKSAKKSQIIYACQDIPVFHHYQYPALSRFKMFYWMKSIMNLPALENQSVNINEAAPELSELGTRIYKTYCEIPSIEIWTDSTIMSTVKQIAFYWESGLFKDAEDAIAVCESLRNELLDIQRFAASSSKKGGDFKPTENEEQPNYTLYYSEIEITNNCVLVNMGDSKAVYLGHFSFNTMSTSDNSYCLETEIWLNNMLKKSVKISGISEKLRNQFFRKALLKLDALENKIRNPET